MIKGQPVVHDSGDGCPEVVTFVDTAVRENRAIVVCQDASYLNVKLDTLKPLVYAEDNSVEYLGYASVDHPHWAQMPMGLIMQFVSHARTVHSSWQAGQLVIKNDQA
jgi:hypothetical protein